MVNLSYISEEDWKDFVEQHTCAYSFLVRRNLSGEYWFLRNSKVKGQLTKWQSDRLNELEILFEKRYFQK
jgi:hypothetical protein